MTRPIDPNVEQTVERVLDASTGLEVRAALLAALRAQHAEHATQIDFLLLQRHRNQASAIFKLNAIVEELRATADRLTSAPVPEGVFVAPCPRDDGSVLARVMVSGGRELLLECVDEDLLPSLQAGDRVLLTSNGNAVIGRPLEDAPGAGECATVERWLGTGRLVVRQRDHVVVTRAAATLTPATVDAGASVRIDPLSGFAVEHVPPQESHAYAPDDETTSLPVEALAGYDELRDGRLRQIGYAIAHAELAATYGLAQQRPAILLGGPPGVGKTTFARVIAGVVQRETGQKCLVRRLNGAELLSPYVGETEQRIRAFVRELRKAEGWSVVFIDEVDAVARARGTAGNVHNDRFLASWLAELEGFDGRAKCILVMATNRADLIDNALRSRCTEEIEIPRPSMQAAQAIFAFHLAASLPYAGDDPAATRTALIDAAVARLYLPNAPGATVATLRLRDGKTRAVHARELMSGRLIEQICVDARRRAFQRHVEGETTGLRVADIEAALDDARERLRATLTPGNAHAHLADLPQDTTVIAVDRAPRARGVITFLHEAAA